MDKAKANTKWESPEGVVYTVFSNRKSKKDVFKREVVAYTTDFAMDDPNGNWDGYTVHWVTMDAEKFEYEFKAVV